MGFLTDILNTPLTAYAKLVYFCLGKFVNKKGECWPSVARIANDSGISANSVRKAIAELQRSGWLVVEVRKTVFGDNDSNLYRLPLLVGNSSQGGGTSSSEGGYFTTDTPVLHEVEANLSKGTKSINMDYQGVIDEYNQTCPKMPSAISLNDNRKKAISSRIKEYGRQSISDVFVYASTSLHHNGQNDRGWTADLDWLLGPKNFVKMLERAKSGIPPQNAATSLSKSERDDIERRRLTDEYDRRMRGSDNTIMQSKLPSVCRGY